VGIVAYDGKQVLFFKAGAKACANGPPLSGEHAVMADVDDPFAPLPPQVHGMHRAPKCRDTTRRI
jgi:hypothetical protein